MSDEEDEALCYDEPADQLVTPNHRGDNDDAGGEEFLYLGAMMFSFREVRHILRRALALLTSASLLHNNSSDRDIAALSVEELRKMMVMTVLGRDDGDAEPQLDATKEEQEADEETGDLDREKTDGALHGLLATLHGFLEQYRVVPRKGRVAGMHDGRSEVPIEASICEGPNNSAAVVTAASIPSGRGRQPSSTSLNATTTAAVVESDEKPSPSVAVPSGPSGAPPPPARAGSARAVIANAVAAARDIATTRRPNSAAAAVAAAAISLPPPCLPPFRSSSATSFRPTTGGATNESNAALAHHGANHTATATINHNGALPLSSPTPPTGPGGPPGSVSVGSLVFPDYSRDAATTFQTIHKTLHHDDGKSIFAPLAYTESQFGGGGGVVAAGGGGAASPDAAIDIMADHTVTDKRRPTCVPLRNQNATSSHRDSDPLHALEPKRRHFVQQFFNDPKKIENRRQMMLAEELNKLAQTAQAAALLQYRPSSQNRHSAHLQSQLNANTTAGAAAADLSFDGSVTTAPNHNLRLPSNWAGAASPVFVPMHRPASAPLVAAASSHPAALPPSSHPSMPLPTIDVEEVNSSRVATRADDTAAAAAGDEPPHHLSITMDPAHRHPHHHPSQEEVVQSTRSVDVPFSQHVKSLRERRNNAAAAAVGNSAAADVTTTAAAATGRPGSSSSATPPTVLAASHIYADKGLHQRHIAVSQDYALSSSSFPSYAEVGLHSSTTGHSRPGTALQHVWHTTMPSQRLPSPTIQSTSYTMPSSSLLLASQHTSPLRQQQHAGTAMSQVAAPSASSPTPLATTPGTTAAVPSTTSTTTASAIVKPTSVVERATARKVLSASHRVPSRVPLGGMGSSKPLL